MTDQLTLPVLPLREAVLFPGIAMPIGAGRPGTLRAIEAALRAPEPFVLAITQQQNLDEVTAEGLYTVGTIARIGQVKRSLSGMQLVLQGERRAIAMRVHERDGYLSATVVPASEIQPPDPNEPAFVALFREARERALELAKTRRAPRGAGPAGAGRGRRPGPLRRPRRGPRRALVGRAPERCSKRCRSRSGCAASSSTCSASSPCSTRSADIQTQVREELGDRQREVILREQMKAIQKELGEGDDAGETDELAERLEKLDAPARGAQGGRPRARPPASHRARGDGGAGHPHLPRDGLRAALEQAQRGEARHPGGGRASSRRTTTACRTSRTASSSSSPCASCARARKQAAATQRELPRATEAKAEDDRSEGRGRREERRREAREEGQGPDPALRRPPRRRQDLGRQVDRPRHGARVRPHLARRRARRGRHPRPPAHLRRRHAGPHPAGDEAGRHQEPGLPARRGRQARRLLPGRPVGGAARGARSGAERQLHRPLPRRPLRPLRGALHRRPPTTRRTSRRRSWTAWRWSSSRATPRARSARSRGAT